MALLDEVRQQVNTACEAISLLVAQSRTVTRTRDRARTRPGNQSDFLRYALESKTGTADSILSWRGGKKKKKKKKGAKGPAKNELGFAYIMSQSCECAVFPSIK